MSNAPFLDRIERRKYKVVLAGMLALTLVACTASAAPAVVQPTAEPTPRPTPQATPTPELIEVEVEVVPQVCLDALEAGRAAVTESNAFTLDTLDAYVDYPDENVEEFGVRVEQLISDFDTDAITDAIDEYASLASACEAA